MISSKPKDGDALVEEQQTALGGSKFVATRLLLAFFDDLANAAGSSGEGDSATEIAAAVSQLREQAFAEIETSRSEHFEMRVMCGNLMQEIEQIKARLQQLEAACL